MRGVAANRVVAFVRAIVPRVVGSSKEDPGKDVNAEGDRMRDTRQAHAQHAIGLAPAPAAGKAALPLPTAGSRILKDVIKQPARKRKRKTFIELQAGNEPPQVTSAFSFHDSPEPRTRSSSPGARARLANGKEKGKRPNGGRAGGKYY